MKRILKYAFAAGFVAFAGYGVCLNSSMEMSGLALCNIEALADCESAGHDTGAQDYQAENGCKCLACCEVAATNCNCQSGD